MLSVVKFLRPGIRTSPSSELRFRWDFSYDKKLHIVVNHAAHPDPLTFTFDKPMNSELISVPSAPSVVTLPSGASCALGQGSFYRGEHGGHGVPRPALSNRVSESRPLGGIAPLRGMRIGIGFRIWRGKAREQGTRD